MAASKKTKKAILWNPVDTFQNEGKLIRKWNERKRIKIFSKDEMIPIKPGASTNNGR
jgi:hypothetical protein